MSTYLPNLFIRKVGNATSSQIYRVIEDLGFGKVTRISFRGNNAVAYLDWDIPNTRATRVLLEEGLRPLLLYYSDEKFWKVSAYKTYEEREEEFQQKRFAKLEEEQEKREQEQEKLEQEQERFMQELASSLEEGMLEQTQEETHGWDSDESSVEQVPIVPLDYGNVTEFYPITRDSIRARIRNA
jgi:hypothetical protein